MTKPPQQIARHIRKFAGQGLTCSEISNRLGLPLRRVNVLARRHGVQLPQSGGHRVLQVEVERAPAVAPRVKTADVPRDEIMRRVAMVVLGGWR